MVGGGGKHRSAVGWSGITLALSVSMPSDLQIAQSLLAACLEGRAQAGQPPES